MKTIFVKALLAGLLLPLCGTARAQAPVAGQPYQIPAGYETYGPGMGISYGGLNYVIQGDGTMLLAQQGGSYVDTGPSAIQTYQIPAGYETSAAGTGISYGGMNYVVQGDGTMLLAQQPGTVFDAGSSGYTSYYGPSGNTSIVLQGQFVSQPSTGGNASNLTGKGVIAPVPRNSANSDEFSRKEWLEFLPVTLA